MFVFFSRGLNKMERLVQENQRNNTFVGGFQGKREDRSKPGVPGCLLAEGPGETRRHCAPWATKSRNLGVSFSFRTGDQTQNGFGVSVGLTLKLTEGPLKKQSHMKQSRSFDDRGFP